MTEELDQVSADMLIGLMDVRDEALARAAISTDKAGHLPAASFFTRIC